jgi:hypothetical protein
MNREGEVLLQKRLPLTETTFLKNIKEYQSDMSVGCESVPNYYWLKDMCDKHKIPFFLGHAQYMWRISTKKKKDDRIDRERIDRLMNTQCFPLAYAASHRAKGITGLTSGALAYCPSSGS